MHPIKSTPLQPWADTYEDQITISIYKHCIGRKALLELSGSN